MPAPDRKRRLTAFLVALAVLVATPLAVVAADAFTDVPDSNVFHDDIAWLAEANVTKGCNPPDNTEFCPSDNVTREQMAAFMRRLAENKVVDAATAVSAETADHATTADSATTAEDADTLAGAPPSQYETVVAMLQLSAFQGTDLGLSVTDGPFTGPSLDITVPAAGTVLVQSASSWDLGQYTIASWTEVDTETTCDNRFDGDVMAGSFGLSNSNTGQGGATTAGQGAFSVDGPGTHTIHFCFNGFLVTSGGTDIDYSITATWIPADSAFLAPASESSSTDSPAEDGVSTR